MDSAGISTALKQTFGIDLAEGLYIWMYIILPVLLIVVCFAFLYRGSRRRQVYTSVAISLILLSIIEYALMRYFGANLAGLIMSFKDAVRSWDLWSLLNFSVTGLLFFMFMFIAWSLLVFFNLWKSNAFKEDE